MLGRTFVCALLIWGAVTPAAAGDRPSYTPSPDALSLLLLDTRLTSGGVPAVARIAPGFELGETDRFPGPLPDAEAFEELNLSGGLHRPVTAGWEGRLSGRALLDASRPVPAGWAFAEPDPNPTSRSPVRFALNEAMASIPRSGRRRTPLSASLVFRLDGNPDSPAFSLDGGPGVALRMIRRR